MASLVDLVCHSGQVIRVDSNAVYVRILSQTGCAACHAKGACTIADMQEKIIEVHPHNPLDYKPGQQVAVSISESKGLQAVWWGYFAPFLLVVISLFVLVHVTGSEGIAGIISLSLLFPYYGLLYLMRRRLRAKFSFTIDPL